MNLPLLRKFLAFPLLVTSAMMVLAVMCLFAALRELHGFSDFSKWNPSLGESFVSYYPDESEADSHSLKEATALLDSAPMFVPGPWNTAGTLEVPISEQGPMTPTTFQQYPPEIQLNAGLLGVSKTRLIGFFAPDVEQAPIRRESILDFQGLGQEGIVVSSVLLPLSCHVEFTYLETGRKWKRTVKSPLDPEDEHLWSPLIFYGAVGPIGMDAAPFSANTTGLEKLDKALALLVRDLIQQMQLPSGNYRIVAGP
jgi:hypothetical protein